MLAIRMEGMPDGTVEWSVEIGHRVIAGHAKTFPCAYELVELAIADDARRDCRKFYQVSTRREAISILLP